MERRVEKRATPCYSLGYTKSMNDRITVQPLPYKTRQRTFTLLLAIFIIALPFLYLYATGYRFDFKKPTQLISTGGLYLAVDRTGAEIYIDNELVRETRTFRKAFYAQNLDVGTHRVHVQKEGYHTWVKELPVSRHLVTEADAFNLPLIPQVRVISEFQSATGASILRKPLLTASTTQTIILATSTPTSTLIKNPEYATLISYFVAPTSSKKTSVKEPIPLSASPESHGTSTSEVATTTITTNGVQLAQNGEDVYASWVGSFEEMPYYYCAEDFPRYSTSSTSTLEAEQSVPERENVMGPQPVQTPATSTACVPTIRMDRKWQTVHHFDFFPGSTDLVLLALDDGVYAEEIDDRAWQNMQPVLIGKNLTMHVINGNLYIYDGNVIYLMLLNADILNI